MYIYIYVLIAYYVDIESGFWVSIRVSGIRRFDFREVLSPESLFGAASGSGAHRFHPIRIRPVAILNCTTYFSLNMQAI